MSKNTIEITTADHDASSTQDASFQDRVHPWMLACFGPVISADAQERNHRFLEEALELVQACGATQSEAHQLVNYVYGRPVGEPAQEAGGVMVTLGALCHAHGLNMHAAGELELSRIWTKVEQIRAKQAAKPKHSPLPGPAAPAMSAKDAWMVMLSAHSLCPSELPHLDKMRWMAQYFTEHAAMLSPEKNDYAAMEKEQLGDPDKATGIYSPPSANDQASTKTKI